ncbi:MAG: DUF4232 domain-containing protein [Streptosporangiaceae bacterium]|jgi:hypothetical protein
MHLFGRPVFGRPALAAGALICVAALTGCASSGSSQPPAASPSAPAASSNTPAVVAPSSSSAAGSTACATSALQVKLGPSDGYAGGVYQTIDFTNTSGSPCTLTGYPGVSLVTGPPYQQLGLAAKRSTTTPVTTVTLAPGATANAVVQIVDALNFPSPTCQPTKAAALKVFPPDQFTAVYLPDTSYGCGQSVQTLYIAPIRSGSGATQ